MCQIYFNDGADPTIYGRCKVKIGNRKRGIFYERYRKDEFASKEVTHKRKNDDTSDKIVKKNLRKIEIIEEDKMLEKNTNNEIVFFEKIGSVIDFHEFGSIIDVPKDGNCGYHSFLLGLIDIDGNLKKTITNSRFELYEHGVLSLSKLKESPIYGAMPCNNDIKAQNYWQNNILSLIFKENVNFEIDVKENLWWHGIKTSGIVHIFRFFHTVSISLSFASKFHIKILYSKPI